MLYEFFKSVNELYLRKKEKRVFSNREAKKLKENLIVASSVEGSPDKVIRTYNIPSRAQLRVENNEDIGSGTQLVKIPRDMGRTRDITGGLPRVTELMEARAPQGPATVCEIDGLVSFGKPKRSSRQRRTWR